MAKRQQSSSRTKEASGTRGRANTNKTSSRGTSNRRSAARVADNPEGQMQQSAMSDTAGQRNGRSTKNAKDRSTRATKSASGTKSKTPARTRSAR